MKFDLTRLNNNIEKQIEVDLKYSFSKEELIGTDLLECDCTIKGEIIKNSLSNIELDLEVKGTMIIPCAITLKPTKYPFIVNINGELDEFIEENDRNFTNTLDIFPIIWENILMEIPMRVVSDEAKDIKLSGEGWRLVAEEEANTPLSGLADLLDDREVK